MRSPKIPLGFMERWVGVLKVPLDINTTKGSYTVAASLCLSSSSKTLAVPCANAIFFSGDRVKGTRNPVIERLSDLQTIAEILVSKFGSSTNAWVIEASTFNGSFAVYNHFIPSVNLRGEPKLYSPVGFPAASSMISLLSNSIKEVEYVLARCQTKSCLSMVVPSAMHLVQLKTIVLGFSKGGTVVNQLVTELAFSNTMNISSSKDNTKIQEEIQITPTNIEGFFNSIVDIHYVDVGLNSYGAYVTNDEVIEKISQQLIQRSNMLRFVLHGTPRQWMDRQRDWICKEKDEMVRLLELESGKLSGKLQVHERLYFADRPPDLQMHFEIIEKMDVA